MKFSATLKTYTDLLHEAKNSRYFDQLQAECEAYGVKVREWSGGSNGLAYKAGWVKIPKPANEDKLGVAFHEVGHVVLKHCDYGRKSLPRYIQEFEADMWKQASLTDYGLLTERVINRIRWHSLSRLAMAVNRGLQFDTIPKMILTYFADVDIAGWQGHKVFVGADPDYSNTTITFYE